MAHLTQGEIQSITDLIADRIRAYFFQKFYPGLPQNQVPALGPLTGVQDHIPTIAPGPGFVLQDIINLLLTDDGTTVSFITNRAIFFQGDGIAKLKSNFNNSVMDAATGKSDLLSINGVTIAEVSVAGLDMHGNPILNAAEPVSYAHSFMFGSAS